MLHEEMKHTFEFEYARAKHLHSCGTQDHGQSQCNALIIG